MAESSYLTKQRGLKSTLQVPTPGLSNSLEPPLYANELERLENMVVKGWFTPQHALPWIIFAISLVMLVVGSVYYGSSCDIYKTSTFGVSLESSFITTGSVNIGLLVAIFFCYFVKSIDTRRIMIFMIVFLMFLINIFFCVWISWASGRSSPGCVGTSSYNIAMTVLAWVDLLWILWYTVFVMTAPKQ
jgi:hypothetical protein